MVQTDLTWLAAELIKRSRPQLTHTREKNQSIQIPTARSDVSRIKSTLNILSTSCVVRDKQG